MRRSEDTVEAWRGSSPDQWALCAGASIFRDGEQTKRRCQRVDAGLVLHLPAQCAPACRLTRQPSHGLVAGVLAPRSVQGGRFERKGVVRAVVALGAGALALWGVRHWEAQAAVGSVRDQARDLIAEVEADASGRELLAPAIRRGKQALTRAEDAATSPRHAPLLDAAALEWAEVARDLARTRAAEQASDRLEQDVSATQTEIVRSRAAVEQAMARVGRARQDLTELEAGSASPSPARSTAAPK